MLSLSIAANLITAISFAWIPYQVYCFLAANNDFFPPWLKEWLRLFLLFILFCGIHHLSIGFLILIDPDCSLISSTPIAINDTAMAIVSSIAAYKIKHFLNLLVRNKR